MRETRTVGNIRGARTHPREARAGCCVAREGGRGAGVVERQKGAGAVGSFRGRPTVPLHGRHRVANRGATAASSLGRS